MSTSPATKKEEGPRSFARFLELLADGAAHAQLSGELMELGKTLRAEAYHRDAAVRGELTLKIKFTAQAGGSVGIDYEIKSKVPPKRTAHGAMYLTDAGNLVADNPRQPNLPGVLREVPREPLRNDDAPAAAGGKDAK
jgi:hypothetical protein